MGTDSLSLSSYKDNVVLLLLLLKRMHGSLRRVICVPDRKNPWQTSSCDQYWFNQSNSQKLS